MGKSLFRKLVESHLVEGFVETGGEVGLRVDQAFVHDATGTLASLEFEALGLEEVEVFSVVYLDHNTVQVGFENMDDHLYLKGVAERFGMVLSRPGNGVCHQVHLERFARPGALIVGADSHTPTAGGMGALAVGLGGLDVALAMGGRPVYLTYPRVIRVDLSGELRPWVSAKDVALKLLSILTTRGNAGIVLEYGGEGVKSLSVPERATIANMGAEMGVLTSLFPSDDATLEFLRGQGREGDWVPLEADPDARYDGRLELDLSEVEPLVACPHSPDLVRPVSELEGLKLDQVAIGSCTNSSYRDLMTVSHVLRGRVVHKDVQLGISPGSRQVLLTLERDGGLAPLIAAGARLLECACTFCVGVCFSPGFGGVSLRTSNRNYPGRSGTPNAQVYLASPETAAASALTGVLTDPRRLEEMGIPYRRFSLPHSFVLDDSGFVFPLPREERASVEIRRGPNIGPLPVKGELGSSIRGAVAIKVGDKITTDHIIPAGPYLKLRSNVPEYARHVFEPVDPDFPRRALENRGRGLSNLVVAGESYGQGSSREHAALCPMYLGVEAVIAKSFERIHLSNLANFGVLPLLFADPSDYYRLEVGDELLLPSVRRDLEEGRELTEAMRPRDGLRLSLRIPLSQRQRELVLLGGARGRALRGGR